MAPAARDHNLGLTVETYRPGEYTETTWQVVSDQRESAQFVPMSFDRVVETTHEVDQMFSDFGTASDGVIHLSSAAGDFSLQPIDELTVDHISVESETSDEVLSSKEVADVNDSVAVAWHDDSIGAASISENQRSGQESGVTEVACSDHHGVQELHQELLATQRQLEERYSLLWEDMQTQLEENRRLNEARAADLAFQVAKRLIGDVVEQQRDYIHQVIHEAIKVSSGAEILAIRVSPSDYDFLKLADYGESHKFANGDPLKFVSDQSIRAGCILVTSAGEVDYDLDAAWERIRSKARQEPES